MARLFGWRFSRRSDEAAARQTALRRAMLLATLESPGGHELLAWLMEHFHILTGTVVRADKISAEGLAYLEGQRSVVLAILDIKRVDPAQFERISTQSDTEPTP